MTVGQLLDGADSRELTEWQAYWKHLERIEADKSDGRRIKWNDDDE